MNELTVGLVGGIVGGADGFYEVPLLAVNLKHDK